MSWIKSPYEWAEGKSGHVWVESKELVDNLILKGWVDSCDKAETVKLLENPESATFLHTPKNERTYYRLFVKDLGKFYRSIGWLHGYYH